MEIMFVETQDGEPVLDESSMDIIGTASDFLNLAQMLGYTLEPIRTIQEDEVSRHLECFESYLKEAREARKERFSTYCTYLVETLKEIRETADEEIDDLEDVPAMIDIETFDEDVRVLLGGFMLSDDPIPQETITCIIPFIGLSLGFFRQFAEYYKDERSDVAEAFHSAYEYLQVLSNYCDQAIEQEKMLFISA
jgi:hypothetical protein